MITDKDALTRITAYCALTERCLSDVRLKLKKWELPAQQIDEIVQWLQNEQYLDEERYCQAFVKDKYRFAKWGERKIKQALQQKGVSGTVIDHCLRNTIDEEEYLAILQQLLKAKRRTTKGKNEYEINAKLIRFALGRGFVMKDIMRFVHASDGAYEE